MRGRAVAVIGGDVTKVSRPDVKKHQSF